MSVAPHAIGWAAPLRRQLGSESVRLMNRSHMRAEVTSSDAWPVC